MAELQLQLPEARSRAQALVGELSLEHKVGQLVQAEGAYGHVSEGLYHAVAGGHIGSVINEVDPGTLHELQRIAREDSAHGIPLLIGRDVIHGFKTIMPIPLGMAATWDDGLIEEGARMAAWEAAQQGVNWTFAPMLDVSRDPRWGRIAESFGEDPMLTGRFGAAMVRGFQNGGSDAIVACAKHFVGYGACEAGKDYNATHIADVDLRNIYLPPFEACVQAGVGTLMPSFSDLNGRPPSGNVWLLRDVLRQEWGFDGFVVSDWESIPQLAVHGVAENERDAARQSALAGVNMDMVGHSYGPHLADLVRQGVLPEATLDALVTEVLTVKFAAGLFDAPPREYVHAPQNEQARRVALNLAERSAVLLKNEGGVLPLDEREVRVCLLGPMADQPDEQLGTWVFDGDVERSVSLHRALHEALGDRLTFDPVLATTRDRSTDAFDAAVQRAEAADVIVLALGEEAILSGEAHCRADVTLPGAQSALLQRLSTLGKPVVAIILAGRPLVIPEVAELADALIYAWHPGSLAGPALTNVLLGRVDASGRLPVTLPRANGQIPIYYGHGHTGKPATPETIVHMDDIDAKAPQTSVGNTCFHLDVHPSPLYPFGFGLSYTAFEYHDLRVIEPEGDDDGAVVRLAVDVENVGARSGRDVVQLYMRDPVASIARPVRELKAFAAVELAPGERQTLAFALGQDELSFHDGRAWLFEPGWFQFFVGGDVNAGLSIDVRLG